MEPGEIHPTSEHRYLIDAETLHRVLHDLRNPLTLMEARTQVLRRNIEKGRIHETHECRSALAVIEQATQRMEAMLKDLLDREQGEWPRSPVGKGMPDPGNGPLLQ